MQKLVGEKLTKGCRKTILILHVYRINDTYFQDVPVSEHGQSISVLLSLTKRKC